MLPDDQPSPEIIEDDEKLDKFMDEYFKSKDEEKVKRKANKRGNSQSSKRKLNAWKNGEELIITPNHPDYLNLSYTEKRIAAGQGVSEVEVIAPNSRRARNRRAAARNKSVSLARSR